jgi:hypothetical protein
VLHFRERSDGRFADTWRKSGQAIGPRRTASRAPCFVQETEAMWILRILKPRPRLLKSSLAPRPTPQDELFDVIRRAAVWIPFY